VRGAPEAFGQFSGGPGTRTPAQILAHMGDLFDWALSIVNGDEKWHDSTPLPWTREVERFFATLEKFDERLASAEPLAGAAEQIFAGPIADALTHTGQIAMLRRMAGAPIRGENYYRAKIQAGRAGMEQAPPVVEFD